MADTNFIINIRQQGAQQAIQQMQPLIGTLQQLGNVTVNIKPGVDNLNKSTGGLGAALAGLTSRALLTIPVWMTLRETFMAGIRTFEDSVKSIVDIDTAMKHLEMQLVGTKNAAQVLANVKIQAQNLAISTGESPASLIDVFNQLVTVGFDVQDAFKGMQTAAKGALVTNTDSKDITNVLVNVYKELGSSITAVHSPADKLNYILTTMTVLMQKNHLGIKDFEASLKTFAGQAAASNLTLDQTMSLIAASANVSQTGQLAGRGLTGIFRQITLQKPGVEEFLGKSTGGQSDWQTFLDVLNKFQNIKVSDSSGLEAISKIFSLRGGGQALRALAEDAGHLTDNLKLLYSLTPDERQAVFAGRLTIALAMIQHQSEITKQTVELLGRTFIEGLTGTNDFASALKNLNQSLLALVPTAKTVGDTLNATIVKPLQVLGLIADLASNNLAQNRIKQNMQQLADRNKDTGGWIGSYGVMPSSSNTPGPSQSVAETAKQETSSQKVTLDVKKQIALIDKQMESLGYTRLETLKSEITLLEQQHNYGEGLKEIDALRVEYAKEYANEVAKSSQSYLNSAQKSLTDLFMGNVKPLKGSHTGVLGAALAPFGNTIREGYDNAFSGNITQNLFGTTGLAQLFGKQTTGIRNMGSDPTYQGAYKGTYDGVTAAFTGKTGGSGAVAAQGATSSSTVLNQIIKGTPTSLTSAINAFTGAGSGAMSPLAWPGVTRSTYSPSTVADYFSYQAGRGNTGNFAGGNMGNGNVPSLFSYLGSGNTSTLASSAKSVASTGTSAMTNINGFLSKTLGISSSGQFTGTLPGFGKGGFATKDLSGGGLSVASGLGALIQGFSTYNSLGGASGSMALPSSILGTMGSVANMIPGGQVIGTAMQVIGGILGLFNTTKKVTDQISTHQVASKLDESNKQLSMINRNLVAMKSSIDTYIMPNSAYFATKGNLSDQFSIDSRRA